MNRIAWEESVPVQGKHDVIVADGLSGIATALSAARNGCSVLLPEKQCRLAGYRRSHQFPGVLLQRTGKVVIHGMAEEFLRLSYQYGFDTLVDEWKNGEPRQSTDKRCCGLFSSGIFALTVPELLKDADVKILYDVVASAPVMAGSTARGSSSMAKAGACFMKRAWWWTPPAMRIFC